MIATTFAALLSAGRNSYHWTVFSHASSWTRALCCLSFPPTTTHTYNCPLFSKERDQLFWFASSWHGTARLRVSHTSLGYGWTHFCQSKCGLTVFAIAAQTTLATHG